MKSLALMPGHAVVKVLSIVLLSCALIVVSVLLSPSDLKPHVVMGLGIVGVYLMWVFWPRLRWGCGREGEHMFELASHQDVFLTFDDGPTPGLTDRVLDVLKEKNFKASFFVLMSKAQKNPELIKRMVHEGHRVELHGFDHRKPFFKSAGELSESLKRAKKNLEALTGRPVRLYRPSHGWKTIPLVLAARRAGLKMCFWDYGVWDTDAPPLDVLMNRIHVARQIASGRMRRKQHPGTLLFHDGRGDDPSLPKHSAVLIQALHSWDEKRV